MNKVILMGRLTRDAEIRYAQGDNSLAIARFSLAVDRRYRDVYKRQYHNYAAYHHRWYRFYHME